MTNAVEANCKRPTVIITKRESFRHRYAFTPNIPDNYTVIVNRYLQFNRYVLTSNIPDISVRIISMTRAL